MMMMEGGMVMDHECMSMDCDNMMCKKGMNGMMMENGRITKNGMNGGMNGMMME